MDDTKNRTDKADADALDELVSALNGLSEEPMMGGPQENRLIEKAAKAQQE